MRGDLSETTEGLLEEIKKEEKNILKMALQTRFQRSDGGGIEMWFEIYKKKIGKYEKEASDRAKEHYEERFVDDYQPLTFENADIEINEIYFDDDNEAIHISGTIEYERDEIAFIGIDIDIPFPVLVEYVIYQIRKNTNLVNKVKSVLEDDNK